MKRVKELASKEKSMGTLVDLTNAFEGIASLRIARIKDEVIESTKFFNTLWNIYSQVHVGDGFGFGRERGQGKVIDKELFIVITAEGGLSGDIDQRVISLMLKSYVPSKHDIVVIGRHGAQQLFQSGVNYKRYFRLPIRDENINVTPIVKHIQHYKVTRVFYEEYNSLMVQEVKSIALSSAVHERGDASKKAEEIINEDTYIFEPSTYAVVAHLERSMMQIAVSQLILESKLAQYASRFRAMSASHELASDSKNSLHTQYNRARRAVQDERLKEIINGLNKSQARGGF